MFTVLISVVSTALSRDGKQTNTEISEYGAVEEKKEKRGKILRWKFTRPPGKVSNKGEWKPSEGEARKDLWDNGTTKTPTTDGFSSSGSVVGVVFKEAIPPTIYTDPESAMIQKDKPDRGSKENAFRWVVKRQCVVVVNYAEEHGPTYQYFTDDDKPLDKAPSNVPQNEQQ
jgi:hypothetical protein